MNFTVKRVELLPDISGLLVESRIEGFRFLERLVADYQSGANRFDQPGECLFAVFADDDCVAIGGLNIDPSGAASVGRVRRLYVGAAHRKYGLGRALMVEIEAAAKDSFSELCLFTDTERASTFYETIGYQRVNESAVSHRKLID